MSTTALIAEFLVIGLIPFFAIVFAFLSIFEIKGSVFLLRDVSAPLTILAMLWIYLLGALTHRIGQLVNTRTLGFLLKLPIICKIVDFEVVDPKEWNDSLILALLFGSDQLQKRIQYNESLVRIFKSTTLAVPFLVITLSSWLLKFYGWKFTFFAIVAGSLIALLSATSFLMQRNNLRETVNAAARMIREYKLDHYDSPD